MYRNPEDEDNICKVLKSLVEEFGSSAVTVSLPRTWHSLGYNTVGTVKLLFETDKEIVINVNYGTGRIQHSLELLRA